MSEWGRVGGQGQTGDKVLEGMGERWREGGYRWLNSASEEGTEGCHPGGMEGLIDRLNDTCNSIAMLRH